MLISWDDKKAAVNEEKHGITFEEGATVLFSSGAQTFPDPDHEEDRFVTVGFSAQARVLVVVYTYRLEDEIRIISARKATAKERKDYAERV